MARSFGRKNTVNKDLFAYNIMLLGESGVGKTSMMAEVMKKFCNDDEYLVLQIGKEEGCKAINGLMWEQIDTWKQFTSFVDEVVKNREDWGSLKCVTIDTIDQLIDIATDPTIKLWNTSQMGKKDFTPATTLNQSWGGFGEGDKKLMSLILDQIWKLKSVGVSVFIVGHTRRRENVDPVSGMTYSTMSAAISLSNFERIKTKMDVVSIAYIDREMVSKDFGKENIVTKKQKTINEVTNEARKIAFRSSAYVLDSKSRFPDIVNEVPLDATAFVEAIQDAINKAAEKGDDISTPAKPTIKKQTPKVEEPMTYEPDEEDRVMVTAMKEADEAPLDLEEDVIEDIFEDELDGEDESIVPVDKDTLAEIRANFKTADASAKAEIKTILGNYGGKLANEMKPSDVAKIKEILEI